MNTLTQQQINQYQWQAANGVARIVNPFASEYKNKTVREIGGFEKAAAVSKNYAAFEKKFGDICFTSNAPDGIYSGEAFELEHQGLYESGWFKISELVYRNYITNPIDLLVEDTRLYLRLKPSHLPAVLTTQPGEEWKGRYRCYIKQGNVEKECRTTNDTFLKNKSLVWRLKDVTPPAEQEGGTVEEAANREYPLPDYSFEEMRADEGKARHNGIRSSFQKCFINGAKWKLEQLQSTLTQKDQRIAELEREREWISVEDRLPNETGNFMGSMGNDMHVYRFNSNNQTFSCWPVADAKVTHWMPLPTPPQH